MTTRTLRCTRARPPEMNIHRHGIDESSSCHTEVRWVV